MGRPPRPPPPLVDAAINRIKSMNNSIPLKNKIPRMENAGPIFPSAPLLRPELLAPLGNLLVLDLFEKDFRQLIFMAGFEA